MKEGESGEEEGLNQIISKGYIHSNSASMITDIHRYAWNGDI